MNKFIKIIIIATLIFAGLSILYYQRNVFSKDVLRLEIIGPEEVVAGQEVEFMVRYKNNGNIRLEEPKLIFEYPLHSIPLEGPEFTDSFQKRGVLRAEGDLEDIGPGEEKTFYFKAILFGRENSTVVANAWVSYRPKNLNVRYESERKATIVIKSIPIVFDLDLPLKVEPNREFTFHVNYFSNVDYPLVDLGVVIDYPVDFEFIKSQPQALEKKEWKIPLLNKADGRRIEVTGILSGDFQDAKIFKAVLGIWRENEFVALKEVTKGVSIARPGIFINSLVNGSPYYSAKPGEYLYYQIFFKNIGDSLLENMFLVVQLDRKTIDLDVVQAGSGKFQKDSGLIIWDSTVLSQLRFLPSMEEGKVEFWVKVKDKGLSYNPEVRNEISLGQIKEEIIVKINTDLLLSQKAYFNQGPFENYGSIPPRSDSSTSYTINWKIDNSYNDVNNLKVRATLPFWTRLSGEIIPQDSKLSFDSLSREVVWEIGELKAGQSSEIYFQVILTPTIVQKGGIIELISAALARAEDIWTGLMVETNTKNIDTTIPDDPTIGEGMGIIN